MKCIVVTILLLSIILLSCGLATSPITPPIPTTSGIIPLSKGNSWTYSFSHYDSSGSCISSDMRLDLDIPDAFRVKNDTELVPLSVENRLDSFSYCYKFEYESLDSGMLVTQIGTGTGDRGIYFVGKYNHSNYTMYKKPILWLPFPADSGKKWTIQFEGEPDSLVMELLSTKSTFYYFEKSPDNISPVKFKNNCYLYREIFGTTVSYYYYHEDIGLLGFLQYKKNVLRENCILTEFYLNQSKIF